MTIAPPLSTAATANALRTAVPQDIGAKKFRPPALSLANLFAFAEIPAF
jgi:hypothetical protein